MSLISATLISACASAVLAPASDLSNLDAVIDDSVGSSQSADLNGVPQFQLEFSPPHGFLGPGRIESDSGIRLEYRHGFGADQSKLLLWQINRVGGEDIESDAQRCLEEKYPEVLARKGVEALLIENDAVVGVGVRVPVNTTRLDAEVMLACIPRPFGAVVAIFVEPKLRGEPSQTRNVIRALAEIKLIQ